MGMRDWLGRLGHRSTTQVEEVERADMPKSVPPRAGFEYGISPSGLDEYQSGIGVSTQTDRHSLLQELYEAYLACPWSWASVQAISRTITAGGILSQWDSDDGEGDQEIPAKPSNVLLLERFLRYCNPTEDIIQVIRRTITDLLVFGDAYLEITWLAGIPVAMYNLDCPTMYPVADEHGQITAYVQLTEFGQRARFEPRDVIHISLDSPRSGILGVSPTQAALLPITSWLFAAATGKETFRKGMPTQLHVDFPASTQQADINRWTARHAQRNVGPRNIGTPITTKGGAVIHEFQTGRVADIQAWLDQKRDEIIACYGVPPAQISIIESGNLGGGTGESQFKTFLVNTCGPIAELVLEKLNFHIAWQGFGVEGWHLRFRDVDWRDSKTIEEIQDIRLRNGSWTLNRYRTEIGEPPIGPAGDVPVVIERQFVMTWEDATQMSKANIVARAKASNGTIPQPMADALGLGPQVPALVPSGSVAPNAPEGMLPPPPPPAAPAPPAQPGDDELAPGDEEEGDDEQVEAAFQELIREAYAELELTSA